MSLSDGQFLPGRYLGETPEERVTRARTVRGVPTAFGLFVGAGGLDLGFRAAGFDLLGATDVDPNAERTHALNWEGVPFLCQDIRTVTADQLREMTKGRRPDVLIGGPPCQGFSTLGDRLSADPRNDLVDAFVRVVGVLRPQAIVMENVRAIATEYKGRYRDYVIDRLTSIGYTVSFAVLNAAEYGVPQLRHRAFFVAFADPRAAYEFPEPTHGPGRVPFTTVGQAIDDLIDASEDVPNHVPLRHTDRVVARYRLIPEGGMLPPPDLLPAEIRRQNFGSTYKRLHRDRPSLTIVPGNNALPVHPVLDRSLTAREAARIQTFPDSYLFAGDRRSQCSQVGNAVPPLLAEVMARSVWDHIVPLSGRAARLAEQPSAVTAMAARRPRPAKSESGQLTFVDLFSGVGGFHVGLVRAGLSPLVSADFNARAAEAHRHNYPDTPFVEGDLSLRLVQEEVLSHVPRRPFLVVGGPPCQGFSVFGRRRMAVSAGIDPGRDPRNRLVLSFVDTATKLNPSWIVMENVAGFASMNDGAFVEAVVQELKGHGYTSVEHRILDAADYGVPQHRKRFILIANRHGLVIPWPKRKYFAEPTEWQRPYRTVGEAISDLAAEDSYSTFTCHSPMNHLPRQVERYRCIPEGGRLDVEGLPEELKKGYRTDTVKNFSHVFRRLDRNKPSLTLVPGHNAFPVHPWLDRTLTVREAARLQTFPDWVDFAGARQDQCIQVGNAFPPLLAELLANNLMRVHNNQWTRETVSSQARYSLLDLDDVAEAAN